MARQVLQDSFAKEAQEEDPYTKMARQLEERKKGQAPAGGKNLEEEKGPLRLAQKP